MDMGVQQKPGWTSDHRSDESKDVSVDLRVEHHQGDKIVHLCKILCKISAYQPHHVQIHTKEEMARPPKATEVKFTNFVRMQLETEINFTYIKILCYFFAKE